MFFSSWDMFFQSGPAGPRKLSESKPSHCQHPATHGIAATHGHDGHHTHDTRPCNASVFCCSSELSASGQSTNTLQLQKHDKAKIYQKLKINSSNLWLEILYSQRGPGFESGACFQGWIGESNRFNPWYDPPNDRFEVANYGVPTDPQLWHDRLNRYPSGPQARCAFSGPGTNGCETLKDEILWKCQRMLVVEIWNKLKFRMYWYMYYIYKYI